MTDKDRIIVLQKQLSLAVRTLGRIANGMETFDASAAANTLEAIERLDLRVSK